jgi:hypothetical protein
MATAERSGQRVLTRAAALTALDTSGGFGIFEKWSRTDPDAAAAMQELQRLPWDQSLADRVRAVKPFKAEPVSLRSTPEDKARVDRLAQAQAGNRSRFYGQPVGRGSRRRVQR